MVDLALFLADNGVRVEQCQIFTPTPGTAATVMYATGLDPATLEPVFVERTNRGKQMQKALILFRQPEQKGQVRRALEITGRREAAKKLL